MALYVLQKNTLTLNDCWQLSMTAFCKLNTRFWEGQWPSLLGVAFTRFFSSILRKIPSSPFGCRDYAVIAFLIKSAQAFSDSAIAPAHCGAKMTTTRIFPWDNRKYSFSVLARWIGFKEVLPYCYSRCMPFELKKTGVVIENSILTHMAFQPRSQGLRQGWKTSLQQNYYRAITYNGISWTYNERLCDYFEWRQFSLFLISVL